MRRQWRIILPVILLTTLIYLILRRSHSTIPKPNSKVFAWNTITYKPRTNHLPASNGVCPGLSTTTKSALIISHTTPDGDPTWLDALSQKYHLCLYRIDQPPTTTPPTLRVPANRGHEAITYLTFLIDNYSTLPASGAVFVHGSRFSWHVDARDYDNAVTLRELNVSAAVAGTGYHNLRCDWGASMCDYGSAGPQGSWGNWISSVLEPWNERAVSDVALVRALETLFGDGREVGRRVRVGSGEAVRAQCCAQFVVARERLWAHDREEYVALRQWLLDEGVAPRSDRVAGRVLSYLWHILFLDVGGGDAGEGGVDLDRLNALACPSAQECYCRLYGRCDFKDKECSLGRCHGGYTIPPEFKLPEDWVEKHS